MSRNLKRIDQTDDTGGKSRTFVQERISGTRWE